jgi:hypothetical protein
LGKKLYRTGEGKNGNSKGRINPESKKTIILLRANEDGVAKAGDMPYNILSGVFKCT